MSVFCSLQDNRILPLNSIVCVHHVAVRGEAVNSNGSSAGGWILEKFLFDNSSYLYYDDFISN